ncbi:MAG: iron ABC transporter permease [Desulfobacteraceae bacterium]|jgi:iron complex transport system permease protein
MSFTSTKKIAAAGTLTQAYVAGIRSKLFLLVALVLLLLIISILAILFGAYDISMEELFAILNGKGSNVSRIVIINIRLTRVVAAIVCGWGLALSGLGLQSLLKNNLGSPFTMGLSQGASFGAALAVVMFNAKLMTITIYAFAGTLFTTLIILSLAQMKRFSPEAIILAGVAISAFFHSATIFMQYLANETDLAMIVFWTFGDVARSNWQQNGLMAVVTLLITFYFVRLRWDLNALLSGEETAQGLGVNVEFLRFFGLIALTLVVALATAFHGVIGFMGLIAPHIARRMVGDDHRLLIPFTIIIGALLLLSADTLGRLIIGSGALPVGVITSFLGAPVFLYLLIRRL